MPEAKNLVKQSIEILKNEAEKCFEVAQTQHNIADAQHACAEKLVILGSTLKEDAIELAEKLEKAETDKAIAAITSFRPKAA